MVLPPGLRGREAHAPARGAAVRLVIHGGAGSGVRDEEPYHDGLRRAAEAGWAVLSEGGGALNAVQAAAVELEDDPLFNAGRGAVVNEHRDIEHDAALMCGHTGRVGGVASVHGIRNPIRLARVVMEATPHVLMVSTGAEALADREGVKRVDPSWHRVAHRDPQLSFGDTIGAVAIDADGHLAAATSTGGIQHKLKGRVGDSPLPGAGIYAADESCAVSASGHGEAIMRSVAAHEVAAIVRHGGRPLDQALREAVARVNDTVGMIALDSSGEAAIEFNTPVFHRAIADADGVRTAVSGDWR